MRIWHLLILVALAALACLFLRSLGGILALTYVVSCGVFCVLAYLTEKVGYRTDTGSHVLSWILFVTAVFVSFWCALIIIWTLIYFIVARPFGL